MTNSDKNEEISNKLSVIISLLNDIKQQVKSQSLRDAVAYFSKFKLSNKDISEILNISEKHVSKEKSLSKKKNDFNLSDDFLRVRVYSKTNWPTKNVVLVRKQTEFKSTGKTIDLPARLEEIASAWNIPLKIIDSWNQEY